MARPSLPGDSGRLRSAIAVTALHLLIGYALTAGLGFVPAEAVNGRLNVFNVPAEPPPPPVAEPAPAPVKAAEGAASPANLKARASPVAAPEPMVRLPVPSPVIAAPVAGSGLDRQAGASGLPGPGAGSGGIGSGTGSGGQGTGTGGGTTARAKWLSGRIVNSDYPRSAWKSKQGGSVTVRFTVGTNGRANGCSVTRSSGNAEIDAATCRLIEQRFRYDPARDAGGRPVRDVVGWRQDWWLE